MNSANYFDRLANRRMRLPLLPLHKTTEQPPSEYPLERLSPRPDDGSSLEDGLPRAWADEHDFPETPRRSSSSSGRRKAWSPGSLSKFKPRPMFTGPPPPITASMVMSKDRDRSSQRSTSNHGENGSRGLVYGIPPMISSVLFDPRPAVASLRNDSHWRGFRRQEKALEQEVQKLLDYQAAGLIAGSGIVNESLSDDIDAHSDGSSTPTGTFYSTKSSKSRMAGSLYMPIRATVDGNILPVRQPTKERPLGLRATRAELQKSIRAIARLKREEAAHLEAAVSERKDALEYLENLNTRSLDIRTELCGLDQGDEEPLGQQLRELGVKCDTLDKEILLLEEKLVAMKDRRRWLSRKMDDVKNQREAGLSGYRGALKEVEAEVTALMLRPPVDPLDPDILSQVEGVHGEHESLGGIEFFQLIPERRTMEMAETWWKNEIAALESLKVRIDADRQALEEGDAVWELVMQLVTDFESSMRQLMKFPPLSFSAKGKEKMPSQEEMIQNQLSQMRNVMEELERHMGLAEEKHWNLLICAIGAESEAFREAYHLLKSLAEVPGDGGSLTKTGDDLTPEPRPDDQHYESPGQPVAGENDIEVPQNLLSPHAGSHGDTNDGVIRPDNHMTFGRSGSESENEVPSEFLAELESQ